MECPTGEVAKRVAGILEDYGFGNSSQISVKRDEHLDRDGSQGYSVHSPGIKGSSIVVLAKSGMDDYVAKVTDAYKI